jgi:hypothetical protein
VLKARLVSPPVKPAISNTPRRLGVDISLALKWLLMAVLVVAVLLPLRSEFRRAVWPQDEGVLLVYPSQMLHGGVPNHSFESVYGAGSLWAVAAAFKLFGYSVTAERGVGLLYWIIIIGSLAVLVGRRRGLVVGSIAGVLAAYLLAGAIGLVASAWIGAVAFGSLGLLLFSAAEGRQQNGLRIAAGACFGLAISYRLDFALSVGLLIALLLALRHRQVWSVLAGIAIGLVPFAINLAEAGVLAMVRGQLLQPVFTSGPGRRLPLSSLSHADQIVLALSVFAVIGLIVGGGFSFRREGTLSILAVGLFEVGLLPQAFQRADGIHVADVACVVLPSVLLIPVFSPNKLPAWTGIAAGALLLIWVSPMTLRPYAGTVLRSLGLRTDPEYVVSNGGRSVPVTTSSDQHDLDQLLATVDRQAAAGQRVFVGPDDLRQTNYNDTFLYFLLPQLTPGSFYLEMEPGVANGVSSRLTQDLRSDSWLILTSRYDSQSEPNASEHYGSDSANKVVASYFRPIGQWGPWHLLVNTTLTRAMP